MVRLEGQVLGICVYVCVLGYFLLHFVSMHKAVVFSYTAPVALGSISRDASENADVRVKKSFYD